MCKINNNICLILFWQQISEKHFQLIVPMKIKETSIAKSFVILYKYFFGNAFKQDIYLLFDQVNDESLFISMSITLSFKYSTT